MNIKIKMLHPDARIPRYGSAGAAAFDLYACIASTGFGRCIVDTGLAFEIPPGYEMQIRSRSGLAFKDKVHAFSGTIDSDYRGEVKVLLLGEHPGQMMRVQEGDRIAQAIIRPVDTVKFELTFELMPTARDVAGFGSTG